MGKIIPLTHTPFRVIQNWIKTQNGCNWPRINFKHNVFSFIITEIKKRSHDRYSKIIYHWTLYGKSSSPHTIVSLGWVGYFQINLERGISPKWSSTFKWEFQSYLRVCELVSNSILSLTLSKPIWKTVMKNLLYEVIWWINNEVPHVTLLLCSAMIGKV